MSKISFHYASDGTRSNLTGFIDGAMYVADETNPRLDEIKALLESGDGDAAIALFNPAAVIESKIAQYEFLSERISVAYNRLYLDGDVLDDVFADVIIELVQAGNDDGAKPYLNFLENVYTNTEAHTRENLSRWLQATNGFTITEDGLIVGYKGLSKEGGSIHHGPAMVDGVAVNGSVPNKPGTTVTMARSDVTADPGVACSVGLHVGTWDYAVSFGNGVTAEVLVHPRDVVSVPTDCGGQKMRVSRYQVVRYLDANHNEKVIGNDFVALEDYTTAEAYEDGYSDAEDENDYGTSYKGKHTDIV